MEVFLGVLAVFLRKMRAQVDIDLYIGQPTEERNVTEAVTALSAAAMTRHGRLGWIRRTFCETDPLMGFPLDLDKAESRDFFARLAHRVIHAEAWTGNKQVFGTVDSPTSIWVDINEGDLRKIVDSANLCGAEVSLSKDND
jgi:hypothetical protein